MRPRILLRTHYQADEPKLIIATATLCSSPTESRHEDAVASAVVKWARKQNLTISTPGAVYAVGNARSLGLLNASNRWTPTGLAFAYLQTAVPGIGAAAADRFALTPPEERLYLRQYILNSGALVIKFGQWLLRQGRTTHDQLRDKSVIEHLVVELLDDYLAIAAEVRDRTTIRRERERLRRSEYVSSTKRHKRYPLLTTMRRLRLIDVESPENDGTDITPDSAGRLASVLASVPDVAALERFGREESLPRILDAGLKESRRNELLAQPAAELLTTAYRYAVGLGLQACPLAYLNDVFYAFFPEDLHAEGGRPRPEDLLERLHRKEPAQVRFHVDRRGRRAFVLISDGLLPTLSTLLAP